MTRAPGLRQHSHGRRWALSKHDSHGRDGIIRTIFTHDSRLWPSLDRLPSKKWHKNRGGGKEACSISVKT